MPREVKLNEFRSVVSELDYPVSKAAVLAEFGNVVLRYADGDEQFGDVLARSDVERFESVDDLEAEVFNNLPTEAVGEPGQSEGEG